MAAQVLMDWREEPMPDTIDPETADMVWRYYRQKQAVSFSEIAKLMGIELDVVEIVIENGPKNTSYCPTRKQIKAECREIQKGWTRKERRQRQVVKPVHWVPALCTFWEADRDE